MTSASSRSPIVRRARNLAPALAGALRPSRPWKRLSPGQRLFAKNLLVGILIAAAVHRWHDISLVTGLQDSAMDTMMQINKNLPRMRPAVLGGKPIEFTFLDIDEETYRTWGEPLLTPRDKLLRMIQFGIEGRAAVVVVDVDLSRPGDSAEADEALAEFLQRQSLQRGCSQARTIGWRGKRPAAAWHPCAGEPELEFLKGDGDALAGPAFAITD